MYLDWVHGPDPADTHSDRDKAIGTASVTASVTERHTQRHRETYRHTDRPTIWTQPLITMNAAATKYHYHYHYHH